MRRYNPCLSLIRTLYTHTHGLWVSNLAWCFRTVNTSLNSHKIYLLFGAVYHTHGISAQAMPGNNRTRIQLLLVINGGFSAFPIRSNLLSLCIQAVQSLFHVQFYLYSPGVCYSVSYTPAVLLISVCPSWNVYTFYLQLPPFFVLIYVSYVKIFAVHASAFVLISLLVWFCWCSGKSCHPKLQQNSLRLSQSLCLHLLCLRDWPYLPQTGMRQISSCPFLYRYAYCFSFSRGIAAFLETHPT